MPTGYTAGIIDGEITTFEQFATNCMRAFGATIHMRDEPSDKKYEPRIPSDYHSKEIDRANKEVKRINALSDLEIVDEAMKASNDEISRWKEIVKTSHQNKLKLESVLTKVRAWVIPSSEHEDFKSFMIQQLESTIKQDGDSTYYNDKIDESKKNQDFIDAKHNRKTMLESAEHSLSYHSDEHDKEIERCETSNKWVEDLISSINPSLKN